MRLALLLLLPLMVFASPIDPPLRPTDKIRLKITSLEAATDAGPERTVLSARLLLCVDTDQDPALCHVLSTTQGFEIEAGQIKNFDGETAKTLPGLYSPVVIGSDVADKLATVPNGANVKQVFFKIELRRNADHEGETVAYRRADFPPRELDPTDRDGVLRMNLPMRVSPGRTKYGAQIVFLIQRQN